jgi:hypothetical protein
MSVSLVFASCVEAIRRGELIVRESSKDKEFHFQDWFRERLVESGLYFDQGGRNSYPDFTMVACKDGYELKGLAYPGRDASFDSNSQIPTGYHNGRTIYYVFGRYPKEADGNRYPVFDLVVCHGDFLNADHDYIHKNKSVKGFGSYGDILIRDRKMYVAPTPFRITEGVAHQQTLTLPAGWDLSGGFTKVGELLRTEAPQMVVGYSFDLEKNVITPQRVPNPGAGAEHEFTAWRLKGSAPECVSIRPLASTGTGLDEDDDEPEE